VFQGFKLTETDEGLVVTNPPTVHMNDEEATESAEATGK